MLVIMYAMFPFLLFSLLVLLKYISDKLFDNINSTIGHGSKSSPIHVGVIMDGNGRWATKRNLPRVYGHKQGASGINNLIIECIKFKIKYITLYGLSTANLKRPKEEVNGLFKIMEDYIKENTQWIQSNNIKVKVIGNTNIFPLSLQNSINELIENTKDSSAITLILALNYDSRTEVCNAVDRYLNDIKNNVIEQPEQLDWKTFNKYLDTADFPDPDLIIRTSGEYRISNFLLLQSANAEYIFLPVLWPSFTSEHMKECLIEYNKRERRFGLTPEQCKDLVKKNN